jgi:hypothetical protein
MRGVFQATIVDDDGNVVSEANIEVRDEVSGDLVQVYEEFEAGDTLGNPFTTDTDGFTRFYLESGLYRVRAYLGAFERIWRHVMIGAGTFLSEFIETGSFTGALSGMDATTEGDIYWERTGQKVTLYARANLTGTSNDAVLTLTGMPVALRPANDKFAHVSNMVDNGTFGYIGQAYITSAGAIQLYLMTVTGSRIVATSSWTGSGQKGLGIGWTLTYSLD